MRLWNCREQIIVSGNLKALLYTIAKHQIIDYFRRQVSEPVFEEYVGYCEDKATDFSPEDLLLYDEFVVVLNDSKENLTERELEIFEMSREHQLSIGQIAEALELSPQTVKNHLSSALHRLRQCVVKYNYLFAFLLPNIDMFD